MSTPLERAQAQLAALDEEMKDLAGKDTLTSEEESRFAALVGVEGDPESRGEIAEAAARVSALKAREERAAALLKEATERVALREEGSDPIAKKVARQKSNPFDMSEVRGLGPVGSDKWGAEYRARAVDAIDDHLPKYVEDETRSSMTNIVERDRKGAVAQHILDTCNPDYVDAFYGFLRTREFRPSDELRAAMSTTGENGGHLIPGFLDPTIVLTNDGSINPFRQVARQEKITTEVWKGVTSAGSEASLLGEAAEVADGSPTFVQPTIRPERASAYAQASFELTQDSTIAEQIARVFADAKDNLEAQQFAVGAGSGSDAPWGVVTRLAAGTQSVVSASTNGAFLLADVYKLKNALPPRYRSNASWLAEGSVYDHARQNFGTESNNTFWTELSADTPPLLLGRPVYESSEMRALPLSTATASNDDILIIGDFSRFVIVDRIGMEVIFDPLVKGSSRRPTGEVGWAAFWRFGSDIIDLNAFRLLRV